MEMESSVGKTTLLLSALRTGCQAILGSVHLLGLDENHHAEKRPWLMGFEV